MQGRGRTWHKSVGCPAAAQAGAGAPPRGTPPANAGTTTDPESAVFLFFSNRVGCLGSLVVSALLTLLLAWLLGWL